MYAPWGFRVESRAAVTFHVVLNGTCWLRIDGADPVHLDEGDLVILSRGDAHSVTDDIGTPVRDLDRILADHPLDTDGRLAYGGNGHRTELLCGGFVLAEPKRSALRTLLPSLVRLNVARSVEVPWLEPTFALLRHEAQHSKPGAQAILSKLADVFLAQALREHLVEAQRTGRVSAQLLGDKPVASAIELIYEEPARRWTLGELAREVGTSRTGFAARFRAVIGDSPMRYVATVRLGLAAGYLSTTELSVDAIARRVGYDTDASLAKAFKRRYGVSPGAYRRGRGVPTATDLNGRGPATA
jgi:AraC-like DNA-binding protein